MKKQTQVVLFTIVAVLLTLSYCHFRKETPEVPPVEASGSSAAVEKSLKSIPKGTPPPPSDAPAAGFLPTQMEDSALFEVLQKNLKSMSACLNMKFNVFDSQAEFNMATFYNVMAPDLGDVVMKNEEWLATDIRTPQGEVRRIFVEIATDFAHEGQRTLKYYSMEQGGGQKEIPLSPEQSQNPSETLLASLEGDGTVIGNSKSSRIYFENGDSIVVVEKNGKIYSFQLPHDGKTFQCTGADSAQSMACQCKDTPQAF